MAVVAVGFTHFDRVFAAGDIVPDSDPLVLDAPHLFDAPQVLPPVEIVSES